MQNSSLPGAFEILKKKHLRRETLVKELKKMKKTLDKKIKPQKLKSLRNKQSKRSKLANLLISMEFRKKMDAVKQNIRKSN